MPEVQDELERLGLHGRVELDPAPPPASMPGDDPDLGPGIVDLCQDEKIPGRVVRKVRADGSDSGRLFEREVDASLQGTMVKTAFVQTVGSADVHAGGPAGRLPGSRFRPIQVRT